MDMIRFSFHSLHFHSFSFSFAGSADPADRLGGLKHMWGARFSIFASKMDFLSQFEPQLRTHYRPNPAIWPHVTLWGWNCNSEGPPPPTFTAFHPSERPKPISRPKVWTIPPSGPIQLKPSNVNSSALTQQALVQGREAGWSPLRGQQEPGLHRHAMGSRGGERSARD